jgi:hypothetical protein
MQYMGNNPADVGKRNVWGIANPHLVDFFNPNFNIEGGNPSMGGGGGGPGISLGGRAPLTTSGFGPVNLGNGMMDPAMALHTMNLERNKYTDPAMQGIQSIFSGEKPAQDAYKAAVASGTNWDKPKGYTPAQAKKYTANAKAHTDTQGTIWKGRLGGGAAKKSNYGTGSNWKQSHYGGF